LGGAKSLRGEGKKKVLGGDVDSPDESPAKTGDAVDRKGKTFEGGEGRPEKLLHRSQRAWFS